MEIPQESKETYRKKLEHAKKHVKSNYPQDMSDISKKAWDQAVQKLTELSK
jgi:uncharacterized protein HemX